MNLLLKASRAGLARTAAVGVAALAATASIAATPTAAAANTGCVGNPSAYVGTYDYQITHRSGLTQTGRMTLDGFNNVFHTPAPEQGDDVVDGRWGMSTLTRQPAFFVETWRSTTYFNVSGTVCRNGVATVVHGSGTVDLRDGQVPTHTFVMTR